MKNLLLSGLLSAVSAEMARPNVIRSVLVMLLGLSLVFCGGGKNNDDGKQNGPPPPLSELTGIETFSTNERMPFNSDMALSVRGVSNGDRVQIYFSGDCSGEALNDINLSTDDIQGSSYTWLYSLNPDLEGERTFSVQVSRMGFQTDCFPLGINYRTASVSAGHNHTCSILNNGLIKCWGEGRLGSIGSGDTANLGDVSGEDGLSLNPLRIGREISLKARKIESSISSCVLLEDQRLRCFGLGGSGQLGTGNTSNLGDAPGEMESLTPIDLGSASDGKPLPVWDFTTGLEHACALVGEQITDLSVKCWGTNFSGQLGLGATNHRGDGPNEMGNALPVVDLGSGRTALSVTAGNGHTCALLDNGTVKCWGANSKGQLGLGDTNHRGDGPDEMGNALPAVDLGSDRTALAVTAGYTHTCALLDNGAVKCWGNNFSGALGLGDRSNRGDGPDEMGNALPAVDLGSARTALSVTAGNLHTCVLLDNGTLKCWGNHTAGKLGLGDANSSGRYAK